MLHLDLHLDRTARSVGFARTLAAICTILGWLLAYGPASAQQPIEHPIDHVVEQLMAQLRQPIASGRAAAATKLARYGQRGAAATERLIECLADSESDVRLAAAYALGCVQQDALRVLEALVPLLADSDEHVRYSAEWSIARIAKGLEDEADVGRRRGLVSAFETAMRHLSAHEHQARHLIAIELALSRLRQASLADAPPALVVVATPPEPAVPAAAPTQPADAGWELASRVYAGSDLLGRLQFVERLRDVENYSDDMRRVVIRFERQQDDTSVLRYAVARWGSRGQELIAEQFDQLSDKERLDTADATVVELVEPSSAQRVERLLELAAGRIQPIEVRLAALAAIARAHACEPESLERLLKVLADASDQHEVRTAAAEALAAIGAAAAGAEVRLVEILQSEKDPWLRHAIARALARTSSASPAAAEAMRTALLQTSAESAEYCDMLECCGAFGTLSAECLPQLVAGLDHGDELVRASCARCLEQLGPGGQSASDALVARILEPDEHLSVKKAAAAALKAIGPEVLKRLAASLSDRDHVRDSTAREHVLRALALAGPAADFACDPCLAVLNDSHSTPAVRSAAAAALGAMGQAAARAVPKLLEMSVGKHPESLRGACLMAAAQIDPRAAEPHIQLCSEAQGKLLRASAACAYRLVGQPKRGFAMLVDMLDGSDTDEVIERALGEFGPEAEPWLLEVAGRAGASPDERLTCFRIACRADAPDWPQLLPLLDDDGLGDAMAMSIGSQVADDPHAIATLLAHLRDRDLTPSTHARMVRLLSPDGLGAGGDDEQWETGLALSEPSAIEALTAADKLAGAVAAAPIPDASPSLEISPGAPLPADPALSTAPSLPVVPSLPHSEPVGGGGRSGGAPNPNSRPVQPRQPVRATGPQADPVASAGVPRVVKVFYGTNRSRIASEAPPQELAAGLLATAGGALVAMLVCLVGFLRSGHRPFALVALVAIGAVAPLGFQAARNYNHTAARPVVAYGGDYRAEIELGVCEVSIPPGHEPGMLDSPNLLKLEVQQDVGKHVVLTSVEQLSKDRFFQQLHSRMDADGKNILVFIHGYNVSFEDAARRTAQMAVDLQFPGAPVFYSWPSQANWYGYRTDKENIELSVTQIKAFLLDLAAKSGATTINLVAHSMGNVGLTEALKEMDGISPQPLFNQVVLAAPDIDADIFKNRVAPYIVTKAQHVTLYTSQTDLALIASRYFNNGPRVGDSGPGVLLFPGIDTIDATAVDSSLLGHSYYGSNVSVLTDVGRVLQNQPIASRQYLRTVIDSVQPYWAFDPVRLSQNPASGSPR